MRKITIDNCVTYIPKIEQTKGRDIQPKTIKTISLLRKQNKNFSQNNKKMFEEVIRGSGFGITK